MQHEISINIKEKLRLLCADLLSTIDKRISIMLAEHSANGLLRSGGTIKRTIDFISEENENLHKESLCYLNSVGLKYYPNFENDIQCLVKDAHEFFKKESFVRLQKSTEIAGNPNLYDRMVSEVEINMASNLAKFQNELNAISIKLKHSGNIAHLQKSLWIIEGFLVLISMFIAGMWYKDPGGNYEPLLVGLGCVIPLIAVGIKLNANR